MQLATHKLATMTANCSSYTKYYHYSYVCAIFMQFQRDNYGHVEIDYL